MTHQTHHLTEAEFADYLIGLSSASAHMHLLECAQCREEMESFGASMASFNQASMEWSREQAAAHPIHIETQAPGRRSTPRTHWQTGWAGLAVAAVLAVAVALPMALMHEHAAHPAIAANPAPQAAPAAQPQEDASVIAEDNQMMTAIDTEISQPEVSPVESFAAFRPQQEPVHTTVHDVRHAARKKS